MQAIVGLRGLTVVSRDRCLRSAALLLALAVVSSCTPRASAPPDFLLILVDTLRADRLGSYGNTRRLTPFLDSLSERSTVFLNAYAASPWTSPSIASLLTSRFQSEHGIVSYRSVLADTEVTFPELLGKVGYTTAGFSASSLIRSNLGYAQGFDEYRALRPVGRPRGPQRAAAINRLALDWLGALTRKERSPFFLYLHYMEPHIPYRPSERALALVLKGREPIDLKALNESLSTFRESPPDGKTLRAVEDAYDAEVLSLDFGLRALFSGLEKLALLDNLVVLVMSDHGEEFMDHAHIGHSHALYNELIRVPMLIHLPGQSARVDVHEAVSLIDIPPTIVELAGAGFAPSFQGRSLGGVLGGGSRRWFGLADGRDQRAIPVFSELIEAPMGVRITDHQRAIVLGSSKLIAGINGEREFYDYAADPGEENPLGVPRDEERELLEQGLGDFVTRFGNRGSSVTTHPPDPEFQEELRALGYVE